LTFHLNTYNIIMAKNKNRGEKKTPATAIALPKNKKVQEDDEPVKNEEKYLRVVPATAETKVKKKKKKDILTISTELISLFI
jgi:hypothetical protein